MFTRTFFKRTAVFLAACVFFILSFSSITWADDEWQFTVAPYIWALNMNGRIGIGSTSTHVDQPFSDILHQLNVAGMLWLELHHDRFGIFLNGLYAAMSDEEHQDIFSIHDKNDYELVSGGLSYQLYRHDFGFSLQPNRFILEPYAGFRYTANQVELTLKIPPSSLTLNNDQYWTDPIVGLRLLSLFCNGFEANLSGDIGGINRHKQYSYNILALIGYQFPHFSIPTKAYLAYRLLDQRYEHGNGIRQFDWNMKLSGPLIGIAWTF
jgi:hypothetical protein